MNNTVRRTVEDKKMKVTINEKVEKNNSLEKILLKISEIKNDKYFDLVFEKDENNWFQIFKENGYISISQQENFQNKILYKLPESIEIEDLIQNYYEADKKNDLNWDEIKKLNQSKTEKIKWYYQSKDYKIHSIKTVSNFEDKFRSESELKQFFQDNIILGCQKKSNFIEVIYDEKKLRVSINKKEKFISFENYNELTTLFNKNYSNLLRIKNEKKILIWPFYFLLLIIVFVSLFLDKYEIALSCLLLFFITNIIDNIINKKIDFRYLETIYYKDEPCEYLIILFGKIVLCIIIGYFTIKSMI